MNKKYRPSRRMRRKMARVMQVCLVAVSILSGYVIGYADSYNDFTNVETVSVTPEVINNYIENKDITEELRVEQVSEEIASTENTNVTFKDVSLTAGVATVLENIGNEYEYDLADVAPQESVPHVVMNIEETQPVAEIKEVEETKPVAEVNKIDAQIIRCTGYCDYGYTKSGEYVREGIIAGKKEWLGRTCNLYRVNEDKSIGELIGSYEFLDTGYGIKTKTANGVQGSLKLGKSVDVWHPTEESIWDWMEEYGDYVYIEFTS